MKFAAPNGDSSRLTNEKVFCLSCGKWEEKKLKPGQLCPYCNDQTRYSSTLNEKNASPLTIIIYWGFWYLFILLLFLLYSF
jgi:hypothetical protein